MQSSFVLWLDERRQTVSMVATLMAAAALGAAGRGGLPAPPAAATETLMTLVLEAPRALAQPAPTAATPPVPAHAQHRAAAAAPLATPQPAAPSPSASPAPAAPSAVAPTGASPGSHEAAAPAPTAPAAPAVAQAVPAAPAAVSPAAVESGYVGQLRALLDATKRYPTGREASLRRPYGQVVVWFVLTRSGVLQDAGIERASESHLLDQAALAAVRRTTYPPFPLAAWPGTSAHRFTATLDFVPPS